MTLWSEDLMQSLNLMRKGAVREFSYGWALMATVFVLGVMPLRSMAQSSSINTYSPYTFYGLGDFNQQGSTMMRSMGGIGVAWRSPFSINYINPAAYSAVNRKSALFGFGVEGGANYLKDGGLKSSSNLFNIREIGLEIPLARGVGFAVTATPFSSVGYRVEIPEPSADILADLGSVTYKYAGEGGFSQIKGGVGVSVTKWLSAGADLVFLIGTQTRTSASSITSITSSAASVTISEESRVAHVLGNFGLQANVIATKKRLLTLGAVYRMGTDLNTENTIFIPSGDIYGDTVKYVSKKSAYKLPAQFSFGTMYHTEKLSLGADYSFEKWKGLNSIPDADPARYTNTSVMKVGGQFTPNRGDVRNFLNRLSYRAGARYGNYYMEMFGQQVTDAAITCGVGVPIRMNGMSNVDFGLEFGRRQAKGHLRENYFKVSIALGLFGEDYWFIKPKFD